MASILAKYHSKFWASGSIRPLFTAMGAFGLMGYYIDYDGHLQHEKPEGVQFGPGKVFTVLWDKKVTGGADTHAAPAAHVEAAPSDGDSDPLGLGLGDLGLGRLH
eukprot:CAMPEP_0114547498 /NCGR_PEP_ID=MMETSP0114-20121206/4495_1 /TAXON_ID=31324 /ORGANISM="Goniomonas sp, Strain m" /LENGTH=104 /DNA_ID=CAMNT_0001732055 /DNA_START=23 /DNA_END=337 /DNA_ORIENTATION=+